MAARMACRPDPLMRSLDSCCCRDRIHYAYVVLAVATLGKVFSSPGQSPCIGVIIEDVRVDLGISRSLLTGLYFAATTASALLLPLGGRWIDRCGPRVMVGVFACGLGVACWAMSRVDQRVHLLFALFLLRFFGQGNMMNVSITEINYWWIARRGLVMGLAGSVVSATMLGIIPMIMMKLITSVGWRHTYVILGLASVCVMAPLGLLLFRGKPEHYGLLPDAQVKVVDTTTNTATARMLSPSEGTTEDATTVRDKEEEANWTTQEIYRSRAFYVFAISDLIIAGTGTAFWFHLRSTFEESGISEAVVSTLYPLIAVVSVVGRLYSGWLIDATSQKHVMSLGLFLQSLGLVLVPVMMMLPRSTTANDSSTWDIRTVLAYLVALLMGSSGSFCSNVRATVYADYYGRQHLGAVQSLASSLTVFGSALGPFPFGLARDVTGSFALPFSVASLFPFLAAVVVSLWGTRGPQVLSSLVSHRVGEEDDDSSSSRPLKKWYGAV